MSKAKEMARTALMLLLAVIVLWAVLVLLLGCEGMLRDDRNEGALRFEADCDEDTIIFELDLDHGAEDKKLKLQGAP